MSKALGVDVFVDATHDSSRVPTVLQANDLQQALAVWDRLLAELVRCSRATRCSAWPRMRRNDHNRREPEPQLRACRRQAASTACCLKKHAPEASCDGQPDTPTSPIVSDAPNRLHSWSERVDSNNSTSSHTPIPPHLDKAIIKDGHAPPLGSVFGHILESPQVAAATITLQVEQHQGLDAALQAHFHPVAPAIAHLAIRRVSLGRRTHSSAIDFWFWHATNRLVRNCISGQMLNKWQWLCCCGVAEEVHSVERALLANACNFDVAGMCLEWATNRAGRSIPGRACTAGSNICTSSKQQGCWARAMHR